MSRVNAFREFIKSLATNEDAYIDSVSSKELNEIKMLSNDAIAKLESKLEESPKKNGRRKSAISHSKAENYKTDISKENLDSFNSKQKEEER